MNKNIIGINVFQPLISKTIDLEAVRASGKRAYCVQYFWGGNITSIARNVIRPVKIETKKGRMISYKQHLSLLVNRVQSRNSEQLIDESKKRTVAYEPHLRGSKASFTPGVEVSSGFVANSKTRYKAPPSSPYNPWLMLQHDFALNCDDNLKAA